MRADTSYLRHVRTVWFNMTSTLTLVWTDEEVGLLLQVTLIYKTTKFQEIVDWESKYADVYHDYLEQYLANRTAESGLVSCCIGLLSAASSVHI